MIPCGHHRDFRTRLLHIESVAYLAAPTATHVPWSKAPSVDSREHVYLHAIKEGASKEGIGSPHKSLHPRRQDHKSLMSIAAGDRIGNLDPCNRHLLGTL